MDDEGGTRALLYTRHRNTRAVPCTERGIALALTQGRGYNRKKKRVKVKNTGGRAHFEETQAWYDGYELTAMCGNELKTYAMYSPKSVVDAMLSGIFDNYWNQTETYEALKAYIRMNFEGLKDDIVRMLAGERIRINIGTFSNDMTTFQGKDDVLTLLVHLGYLSDHWTDMTVSIPNKEVSQEYINAISTMDWKEVIRSVEDS